MAYAYLLTPNGVEQKARLAVDFLKAKVQEYERLEEEIEALRRETTQQNQAHKKLCN